MPLFCRALVATLLGFSVLFIPASTHAGGGVGPSSPGRGGGGTPAAATVNVDHTTISGKSIDFLDYYPRSVTVHQGDTVNFHWVESNGNAFHTVTFVPAGTAFTQQALARFFPGGGGPVPDTDDPGRKGLYFPYNHHQAACGNSAYFPGSAPCNFDGHSVVNSGVLFPNAVVETGKFGPTPPLHFSVTMNVRPGTYRYFCLVHGPGMSGSVTVAPPAAAVSSGAQLAQSSAAQFKLQTAEANAITAHIPPPTKQTQGGHTVWSMTAGLPTGPTSRLDTEIYSSPSLTIKAGDTVVWQPRGLHTVTFPRFAGIPAVSIGCETARGNDRPYRGSLVGCNGLEAVIDRGAIPTGPTGAVYSGGFSNSGILVIPKPHAWSVSFPKAGTYQYQCLIHWGMYGSINVQ